MSFHTLQTRCPAGEMGGLVQTGALGLIPIPLPPAVSPRSLPLPELGVSLLNTWEVRVPPAGGF